ncbi:PD40 domain-containing protein [bacterium]|nr:PD40 domain-containing protein [bacterium]
MKKMFLAGLAACLLIPSLIFADTASIVGARFPALSPSGQYIAFSYLGDLWVVPASGGDARRLTDHQAYDREPIWSPDGTQIAFTSNRNSNDDVYIVDVAGGTPKQLTWHSGNDLATDWTPDGKSIIFSSNRASMSSLYIIPTKGGNPQSLVDTYWSWPFAGKVSPDGESLVFALGMENRAWWRTGYRGSNASKIWTRSIDGGKAVQWIDDQANCFSPHWIDNGKAIVYITDKNGIYNVWKISDAGGTAQPLTKFKKDHARWLSVSRDGSKAAFERKFGIWTCDLATGKSNHVKIFAPSELKKDSKFTVKNGRISEYSLSPDGKKIAAVVRGDIFILGTDGEYARNITKSSSRESGVIWAKNSRSIIYVSDANARPNLYRQSIIGNNEQIRMTNSSLDVLNPTLSPDGKWIAYSNGPREIRIITPEGNDDKLLIKGDFGGRFGWGYTWAPDSKHLAFIEQINGQRDIFAVSIDDDTKIALTNTAYDESNPQWSPNGKFMLFSSNRGGHSFPEFTGNFDLYQVLFKPELPVFDEDKFEKMFIEEKKDKKQGGNKKDTPKKESGITIEFQLDNLDRQTSSVVRTLGQDRNFVLSPKDTQTVYFVSNIDGSTHLWKTSLDKKKRGKFNPFAKSVKNPGALHIDKKGKFLYYLSNGKLGRIDLGSGKSKSISFSTKIEVCKKDDYKQMLSEVYYVLEHYFYDKHHHGLDWKKSYEEFLPVLEQVREDADFYDYTNIMIGYLNSSHTGIRGPKGATTENPTAHVGAQWIFGDDITVSNILKDSPLWLHRDSVKTGDRLLSINDKEVDTNENIYKLFNGLMKKRVVLKFKSTSFERDVTIKIKPISAKAENSLRRETWIDSRKAIVKAQTNDDVAYLHMKAMGYGDLVRFLKELERDAIPRKGLILDLRYNFGGNVHDRVLEALTKPAYGQWQIRGLSRTPQSTFGFADKPVVVLINEVTLSDGEMTSAGFKAIKRGKIVGNTTYGWLVFTGSSRLLNGGSFRLPFWGCYTPDNINLETHGGVTPDIKVINDLNDDLSDRDPQLDRAIKLIKSEIN